MNIARVFPRRTNMTPTDPLAFVGLPTIEAMAMDIDAVHISVTFTWDLEKADELYEAWQILGVGFLPFAMLYRDEAGDVNKDWRRFQREWANGVIVGRKFSDWRAENT